MKKQTKKEALAFEKSRAKASQLIKEKSNPALREQRLAEEELKREKALEKTKHAIDTWYIMKQLKGEWNNEVKVDLTQLAKDAMLYGKKVPK